MPNESEAPASRQRASWRARGALVTALVVAAIGSVGLLWPDEPARDLWAEGRIAAPLPDGPTGPDGSGTAPSTDTSGPTGSTAGTGQPDTTATVPRPGGSPRATAPAPGAPTTGPGKTTITAPRPDGPPPTSSTGPPVTVTTRPAPAGGAAARSPKFNDLVAFVDTDRDGTGYFLAVVDIRRGDPRRLTRMDGTLFSWAPDGVRIAFLHAGSIHVLDTATGAIQALPGSRGSENQPVWSPDGDWIAYRDGSANEDKGLWLMHADGSERHRISGGITGAPAWSPDSSLIAFGAGGPSPELHVLTVDGTALRNLTAGEGGGSSPVFSPDGRRLAFTAEGDTLAVAEVASSEVRRYPAVGKAVNPSWAPDSKQILVEHFDGQATSIRTVDPATGSARQLSPADPGPQGSAPGYRWKMYSRPLWAPDGSVIIYEGDCRGNGNDVCRLNPSTGDVTLLVDYASGPFAFQPRP